MFWAETCEMARILLRLTHVCQDNPHLNIRYNILTFSRAAMMRDVDMSKNADLFIIHQGLVISHILRQAPLQLIQHIWVADGPNVSALADAVEMVHDSEVYNALLGASDEEKRVRARQIRFFPDPDIVATQSFVASATSKPSILLANVQGLLPLWRAAAEKWAEEGI
jgi:hypothetical protein